MLAPNRIFENRLLTALPEDALERLAPHLRRVALKVGQVLCESGAPIGEAYFPTSSILSMHRLMENGSTAEVALIGPEGMIGLSLLLDAERSNTEISVQSPGYAFTIPARPFVEEFGRGGAAMKVLLRYTQTFIAQMAQTAACNRHGTLEQRLCRWLLLNLDRMPSGELEMTHELIANALGVRREGVSEAAGRLQRQGAIHYHRGHLSVLDRPVLESRACECYRMDRLGSERPQILPH